MLIRLGQGCLCEIALTNSATEVPSPAGLTCVSCLWSTGLAAPGIIGPFLEVSTVGKEGNTVLCKIPGQVGQRRKKGNL